MVAFNFKSPKIIGGEKKQVKLVDQKVVNW